MHLQRGNREEQEERKDIEGVPRRVERIPEKGRILEKKDPGEKKGVRRFEGDDDRSHRIRWPRWGRCPEEVS